MHVNVYALFDSSRLGHLVHPKRVFGDPINQPEVAATLLCVKPKR